MIIIWWPCWLALLAAVFVFFAAACQYGLLQVVQVPALAIATLSQLLVLAWLHLRAGAA